MSATTINPERLDWLEHIKLAQGNHPGPDGGACVMEAVAWVAGEPWSDHPVCASPVIAGFLRAWNDALNDADRQMLKPLVLRLVGTAGTEEQELRRSYMALDWHCRVSTPTWLRAAGRVQEAEIASLKAKLALAEAVCRVVGPYLKSTPGSWIPSTIQMMKGEELVEALRAWEEQSSE